MEFLQGAYNLSELSQDLQCLLYCYTHFRDNSHTFQKKTRRTLCSPLKHYYAFDSGGR